MLFEDQPYLKEIEKLKVLIKVLETQVIELKNQLEIKDKRVEELEEQLRRNSQNSSQPPSQDKPSNKKEKKKFSSGLKKGGQKGHVGKNRALLSAEKVDQFVICKTPAICSCGGKVKVAKRIRRHQVYDLPEVKFTVTEYQIQEGKCPVCGKYHRGELPKEVGISGFGVKVHTTLALLTSVYRLSKRQAVKLLEELYQLPISLGSVSNAESRVSKALKPAYEEIYKQIQLAPVCHVDETSYKECNKSGWAWILTTKQATFFKIDHSRGKKVAYSLLTPMMLRQVIVSDRYGAYNFLPPMKHQVCWAHLKRDLTKISERPGTAGIVGCKLLQTYDKLFFTWKTAPPNAWYIDKKYRKKINYLRRKFLKSLQDGVVCGHKLTAGTCSNLLAQGPSLWLFCSNEEVPPTNNLAEQQLRSLVIARKLSFGTQSSRGSRFIERAFSVAMTCRQQNINVLQLMKKAFENYLSLLFFGIRYKNF